MIIGKARLRHIAAGLLGNFVSRNNNLARLWAPGVLYTEVQAGGKRVELDLLQGRASPDTPPCTSVARSYAAFLRTALARQGADPGELSAALVSLDFGLPPVPELSNDNVFGDPFRCTVTLVSRDGRTVSLQAWALCAPHDSPRFRRAMAMREAAFRLHRHVIQRSGDCDGRWSVELLRAACPNDRTFTFDLLREHCSSVGPVGDAVARAYAGQLRSLLGAWWDELGAAEMRLSFFTFPRFPGASVFVENGLVARDGYRVWFNGGADILPAPPWEART